MKLLTQIYHDSLNLVIVTWLGCKLIALLFQG